LGYHTMALSLSRSNKSENGRAKFSARCRSLAGSCLTFWYIKVQRV
jgi:hypothetical protein